MRATVNAEKNQSVQALVIYNLKEEDVRVDLDKQKFLAVEQKLGVGLKLGTRTYIKRLNSPASYFIHCDSIAKTENLPLSWRSLRYGGTPEDFGNKHFHSLTISLRDENGGLCDFNCFPLEFELRIN